MSASRLLFTVPEPGPAELRRRAAYLHLQARQTADMALARRLTVRALRLNVRASELEAQQHTGRAAA